MKNFEKFALKIFKIVLTFEVKQDTIWFVFAGMAELADAHGSGPCGSNTMRVQVSFPASKSVKCFLNTLFL